MNIGRAVDGAASRLGLLGVASRPTGDLERQLRAAEKELVAAGAALEQAKADERDLDSASVDAFLGTLEPGEYDRRVADVQRRLIDGEREVARWTAIVAGVSEKAIQAVEDAAAAETDAALAKIAEIDRLDGALLTERAKLGREREQQEVRLNAIGEERLRRLAKFDSAAAEALLEREKAARDEAAQLAHARIRGEDVDVPDELAALVREHEPLIRADLAARRRDQRDHFRRIGTLPLHEYEQGEPVMRDPNLNLGFSDPED